MTMGAASQNIISKTRDESIDTLKFTLMCLVIFGHCLENFGLHQTEYMEHIYQFIYLFHMPLFVFVSGYFMNKMQDKRKFYSGLLFILETYIVFQLPSFLLSLFHGEVNPLYILNPSWAMWYLPALIVWRIVVYNTTDKIPTHWSIVMVSLIAISVLGGFVDYRDFAFQRIITYFPMFMAGYYCRKYQFYDRLKNTPILVSSIICIICLVCLFAVNMHTSVVFYQNNSYYTQPISVFNGCVFRCIWYAITFILSVFMLPILLRIKNSKMAYYGRHTLFFYVVHVFILNYGILIMSKLGILQYSILSPVLFILLVTFLCVLSNNSSLKI